MANQVSDTVRNAMLDAYEVAIGASPILRVRTGPPPVNCAAADTGTILGEMTLPADWMAAASGGTKAKSGTWQDLSANNAGTIGHFRIYNAAGTTCHHQGTATATGGGGDMTFDATVVTAGQTINITGFVLTASHA